MPGAWCTPIPACDAPPPDPGPAVDWNHLISEITAATGSPNHRGRDLFLNPGDPQWVIAKLSYGLTDKDLKDELVDLYLLRDCGDTWEMLGSTSTTEEGAHPTVEGVEDSGGHVYFEIPPDKALGPGRHRVHLVVRGDLSSTDAYIEVVPQGTPIVVTDVDGTLTGTETEEFQVLLTGQLPDCHPDAPEVFQILASKGYHPLYMTARPEWLVGRTREFMEAYGFPPGVVHTTLGLTGATGASAATYKTGELAMLAQRGLVPSWAFGNTDTDAEAYDNGGIMPLSTRVFYQFDDAVYGGRRIESYTELLAEVQALPSLCE
ncbi:MAG: phosphatidylinositol transfer protein [Polyangiaceae bacterium]|nr:phosphatidylinositol transfer protein [Polyangiaceae bacterium]